MLKDDEHNDRWREGAMMSNSEASAAMAEQVVVVVGRQERRISLKSNNCRSWIEHVTQL